MIYADLVRRCETGQSAGHAGQLQVKPAEKIKALLVERLGLDARLYRGCVYARGPLDTRDNGLVVSVAGAADEPPIAHLLCASSRIDTPAYVLATAAIPGHQVWVHGTNGAVVAQYYRLAQLFSVSDTAEVPSYDAAYDRGPYGMWHPRGAPAGARLLDPDAIRLIASQHAAIARVLSPAMFLRVEAWHLQSDGSSTWPREAQPVMPGLVTEFAVRQQHASGQVMTPILAAAQQCREALEAQCLRIQVQRQGSGNGFHSVHHSSARLLTDLEAFIAALQPLLESRETKPQIYSHVLDDLLITRHWEDLTDASVRTQGPIARTVTQLVAAATAAHVTLRQMRTA